MDSADGVPSVDQPIEHAGIVKHLRRLKITFLAGLPVQAGKGFVHAAVLARNIHLPHFGPLLFGENAKPLIDPVSDPPGAAKGVLHSQKLITVQKACENFVQRVVGRPDGGVGGELFQKRELIR